MGIKDLLVDGSSYLISLKKLSGLAIKDVTGYLSTEYDDEPTFKIYEIILDNGKELNVEGEHDFPYIGDEIPNADSDRLQELYDEENDED